MTVLANIPDKNAPKDRHVILFYKYMKLSSDREVMEIYQSATKELCTSLNLTGRVLIGVSDSAEGLNGTLAGDKRNVLLYTYALLGKDWCVANNKISVDGEDDADAHARAHVRAHAESINADENVVADVDADAESTSIDASIDVSCSDILLNFFDKCEEFAKTANVPVPVLDSPEDFKWSSVEGTSTSTSSSDDLFPDLQIKLVKEIVSTGGVLSNVSIQETSKNYLTPEEWHNEMKQLDGDGDNNNDNSGNGVNSTSTSTSSNNNDTILIDCRNHKEFAVGHFKHAIDPNTKIFAQFPRWVRENKSSLRNKKVLMYCTGGIRCEKASAFIRNELEDVSSTTAVYHLKGGIHKYLDQYGADGMFRGKNFVFDRRLVVDAEEHKKSGENSENNNRNDNIVGKCQYCDNHYDNFTGDSICTVCRENCLVCDECRPKLIEYHCADHFNLRHCYFTNLGKFNREDLESQLKGLESVLHEISIGKRYKQRRQCLHKQCDKIRQILGGELEKLGGVDNASNCRSCGDDSCDGSCWGVHGLKRKQQLDKGTKKKATKAPRLSANNRPSKVAQRNKEIENIQRLGLSEPPSVHRCKDTYLRCPPPCIRVLSSSVKGKWCGKSVRSVLASEFYDFSDPNRLDELFKSNLVQINGVPVNSDQALRRGTNSNKALSPDSLLKNMDIISRIQYWFEPPVLVPDRIFTECTLLPKAVFNELVSNSCEDVSEDLSIYCCDKPSTVPVHPAGPYYQNTLLLMVEAQQGLKPKTLLPCHRIDRCTSGLTLCCTNPKVARLLQVQMDMKAVSKMYLARVKGKFPHSCYTSYEGLKLQSNDASWSWCRENNCVEIDAPIDIVDVHSGIRVVKASGKPSRSRFQFVRYDQESDTSIISCFPLTGRQHQLRVHLQTLGFPIHNDVLYGGEVDNNIKNEMKDKSIQAITNAAKNDKSHLSIDERISTEIIQQAKDICLCCKGKEGIEESFNTAQLLVEGHSIDLHALAYRVRFDKKKKKKAKVEECSKEQKPLAVMMFTVPKPLWASDVTVSDSFWLDN